MRRNRVPAWLFVVGLLALATASCGEDEDPAERPAARAAESTKVKVASLPITNFAPLWIGIEQGYFEEQGLDVEPVVIPAGPALPPLLLNGSVQFGAMDAVSFLTGSSKGLPMRFAAPATIGPEDDSKPNAAVVVAKNSPIRDIGDLAGKSIAVNSLKALGEVTIRASLDNNGVDSSTVKFVEIPFPDMPAALQAKRVDAIWPTEPFLTAVQQGGNRIVFESFVETRPSLPTGQWVTTAEVQEKQPEVVEKFVAAIVQAQKFASENPDAVRKVVPEFAEIPPELLEAMTLPSWSTTSEADRDGLRTFAELARKYGVITDDVDVDALILPTAGGG